MNFLACGLGKVTDGPHYLLAFVQLKARTVFSKVLKMFPQSSIQMARCSPEMIVSFISKQCSISTHTHGEIQTMKKRKPDINLFVGSGF